MTEPRFQESRIFDVFDSRILRAEFPQMDLFQLSPGPFRGWIFSSRSENCRIAAGSFNQATLCEGNYNPDTFHVGFILSPGHSAVVQAREYDNGTLTIHRNAIAMHEVFPADLVWADIAISEKRVPQKMPPFITDKLAGRSRVFLEGSRETLSPLIHWVNGSRDSPVEAPVESELQTIVNELLFNRLVCHENERTFTAGDRFRMHLLDVTHERMRKMDGKKSLAEICAGIGMRPRTMQKYFHEIYGMGPTEYFRIRRLNRARSDLLMGAGKVSEVAQRWEFYHLGRFAARYKSHFGESPRATRERG